VTSVDVPSSSTVRVLETGRDDELDSLALAEVVVGVGTGVPPAEYAALDPLLAVLGAEMGATRKVTDKGWLPRARQIGITGRSIGPRLYVAIGMSGKFNHMVGVRGAGAVLAINPDPDAPIWDSADVGIQAAWQDALPLFVKAYAETGPERLTAASSVPR
jgi:electron transfer flavoprotein alpha subunit